MLDVNCLQEVSHPFSYILSVSEEYILRVEYLILNSSILWFDILVWIGGVYPADTTVAAHLLFKYNHVLCGSFILEHLIFPFLVSQISA